MRLICRSTNSFPGPVLLITGVPLGTGIENARAITAGRNFLLKSVSQSNNATGIAFEQLPGLDVKPT